jgi:hypothetical protein
MRYTTSWPWASHIVTSFLVVDTFGLCHYCTVTETDLIVYEFSRFKVERGDFSHFLSQFALEKLPTGRRLRMMMNSILFCIQGYEQDEREIHCIPEIRSFYRTFHEQWPYWLYFCNLDDDNLKIMTLCCLDSFIAVKRDGNTMTQAEFDGQELLAFLSRDFAPTNLVCERAEMFEDRIEQRTKAILEYFRLPYQPHGETPPR